MEGGGEVCLEQTAERLRRSGKSVEEIARTMGVDPAWVEQLVVRWSPEEPTAEELDV